MMHCIDVAEWKHDHDYIPASHAHGEKQTRRVIALTVGMAVFEVAAGTLYGSMALLADGWHMASHASALGITAFAYWYARRHAGTSRFSFGTGKVGVLGGYTSAVILALIAALIAWESAMRLLQPVAIRFDEAIVVAVLGLAVNLASAWMLRGDHGHAGHGHRHDHNLRAAYLHVLADALTSLTAIVALTAGKYANWVWLDPAMGAVGSVVIAVWSYGLIKDCSGILLDSVVDEGTATVVREALESDGDTVAVDIHVWRLNTTQLAAAITLVAHEPSRPGAYRDRLTEALPSLAHVTLEVNGCRHT